MHTIKRPAAALAAVLLAAVALTGCGGDDGKDKASDDSSSSAPASEDPTDEPSEEPSTTDFGAPAKGDRVKGAGYTYRVPASWTGITKKAAQVDRTIDSAAGEKQFPDGFQDTVIVSFDKAEAGTGLDELEASVPDQVKKIVKKLEILPAVTIDEVAAIHYRGTVGKAAGTSAYVLDQYVAIDEAGKITVISFSFSPGLARPAQQKLVSSVLASWKWSA
ncbi:hypothetical protein [Nocardioides sp. Root140]|uniref:hypothetical protein n=1 Tax=Nocardioides sp. Root140 TaxID=1736460 RepID=UPI00070002F0|nr:hypothetical protein [Nocardioides sp. Root140]KQY56241.1 hypothetical protein ASD30_07745 [Nocardioides sp. Root140]